jgi:hypothetical protein
VEAEKADFWVWAQVLKKEEQGSCSLFLKPVPGSKGSVHIGPLGCETAAPMEPKLALGSVGEIAYVVSYDWLCIPGG